jgi:hypothetical protein
VLAHDGQMTERFTRAVDQLGSSNTDVRLGGLIALERIAVDSSFDRESIIEVIATFARRHSQELRRHVQAREEDEPSSVVGFEAAVPDVQAAITILGRIPGSKAINLRSAYLPGARCAGDFQSADFAYATLRHADVTSANFDDASFFRAELDGAQGLEGRFRRAQFVRATLTEVVLFAADLRGASFFGATMSGASLENALLHAADLSQAVDLEHARLESSYASRPEGPPMHPDGPTPMARRA